jgi:D-alanyl-lipoteichoic acid acyltransferase DltB (MBOAT superfamily)
MLTMLLGGLWHGANWTFVLWGGIHGSGLAIERKVRQVLKLPDARHMTEEHNRRSLLDARTWVRRIIIFHLVCLAWVFFRAPSIGDALGLLSGLGVFTWRSEFTTALVFLAFYSVPLLAMDMANEYRAE